MPVNTGNNPAFDIARPNVEHQTEEARRIYEEGAPGYYPGSTVAALTPEQIQAHQMALNTAAPQQAALADQATASTIAGQGGIGTGIDVLKGIAQGTSTPDYTQHLSDTALAGVNKAWGGSGTFGSARHLGAATGAAQDTAARYQLQRDQQRAQAAQGLGTLGLGFLGQTGAAQQAALAPAQTYSNVGSQLQRQRQAEIDADIAKYNYNANLPSTWLQNYIGNTPGSGINPGVTQSRQDPTGFEKILGIGSLFGGLFG